MYVLDENILIWMTIAYYCIDIKIVEIKYNIDGSKRWQDNVKK